MVNTKSVSCLNLALTNTLYRWMTMPTQTIMSAAKALLICVLALAVLTLRAPVPDLAAAEANIVIVHDHHGHSHDDEPSASSSGYDHNRFHVGDHSHDTPTTAELSGLGFLPPKDSGSGLTAARLVSRPHSPRDRPPRTA